MHSLLRVNLMFKIKNDYTIIHGAFLLSILKAEMEMEILCPYIPVSYLNVFLLSKFDITLLFHLNEYLDLIVNREKINKLSESKE